VINGLRPVEANAGVDRTGATTGRSAAAPTTDFTLPADTGIPQMPPPEVLQALGRVQRVANELQARGLDVRFDRTGDRDVTVQVVDADGGLLREIPVVQALDLLSGDRPLGDLSA
jgi:hypothetical protein